MKKDPFEEYLVQSEPDKKYKTYAWKTGIGLQQVDGLKVSDYLIDIAQKNIVGDITYEKANVLIESYYKKNKEKNTRIKEADFVSLRISQILSEKAFTFSFQQLISIHSRLFKRIYRFAGKIRNYNISKDEWVLDGDTVTYGNYFNIKEMLEYDLVQEKKFDYSDLSNDDKVKHLSQFVSNVWQVHPFGEGNTRTVAVFFIKYLNTLGYHITNDLFEKNSWYFRNALVRANYSDYEKEIYETTEYLELFLKNLLFNEHNILKNRYLHVKIQKSDIENKKQDIASKKPDIDKLIFARFNKKTIKKINIMFDVFKEKDYFGRNDIIELLNIAPSSASELITKLLSAEIITPIKGHGKGKYRFK